MYLSPKQAAEKLGVCKATILRYIKSGDLKVYRLGTKTIRIDEKELEAFIQGATEAMS